MELSEKSRYNYNYKDWVGCHFAGSLLGPESLNRGDGVKLDKSNHDHGGWLTMLGANFQCGLCWDFHCTSRKTIQY